MSYFVNLARSHILLWRVRHYVRQKAQWVQDVVQDEDFWDNQRFRAFCCKPFKFCQNEFIAFVFKSLLGFFAGVVLSLALLMVLSVQVRMGLVKATTVVVLLAPFLCLGLALSARVRCVVLLVLPQFASKRGRQALVAAAFVLALNGPVTNTVYNMHETAHSLTCTLKLTGKGFGKLVDIVERPAENAKRAVSRALQAIETSVAKIKEALNGLQKVITAIGDVLKSSVAWLEHVVGVCNSEFGTPIERCYQLFEHTSAECSATLGPAFSWLCSVVYAGSLVCNSLSAVSLVCVATDPLAETITSTVDKMRAEFLDAMDELFYVNVDYEHKFDAELHALDNRTVAEMLHEMKAELKDTYRPVLLLYQLVGGLLGLAWIVVFYKAYRYHQKFKTSDRFDNVYLTQEVREIDLERLRQGSPPILPLTSSEKRLYCSPGQFRLLRSERRRFFRSLVFLFFSTLNVLYSIGCDYALFWVLDLIRRDTVIGTTFPVILATAISKLLRYKISDYIFFYFSEIPAVKLQVEGQGLIPEMFRNLSDTLSAPLREDHDFLAELNPASCLPQPIQPDFDLYLRIGSIIVLAWVLALLEPFVLRLRPHVLNRYYPERARARAVWLCAHILRERGGFLSDLARLAGARRHVEPLKPSDLIEKLRDRFWLARMVFGGHSRPHCVVCALATDSLLECEALGCNAVYCERCYGERRNVCVVCEDNLMLPDVPGLVLERCSDEEEEPADEEEVSISDSSLGDKSKVGNSEEPKQDEEAASSVEVNYVSRLMVAVENSIEETGRLLLALTPKWPI
ncbi:DC-STAMP domain-containing protein 2-like [Neocloeon triangulifer]|uniref:DC-STAMP domain-containing protein 2-like n=1 Tax=Neocloeon triangulifer TaxID=2078957 RepID=UPI00286FA27B|nr:DC-STAMP domain-containing protein 2-like [Neocloeon triangulifer]